MEKTKLGLPVGITVAAMYLLVHFGGYTPALLLLGFALLYEENKTLKISAVTAVALAVAFSALNALIGLVPSLAELLHSFIRIFDDYYYLDMSGKFTNFLYNLLSIGKLVVFALLAILAAMGKSLQLKCIKKYFE